MFLYNSLRALLYIIILVLSIFNGKLLKYFRSRLFQKIGNDGFLADGEKAVLIHFSSVGEFNLSQELIKKILEKGEKIILTVMTDTGFLAASKKYSENRNVKILYFPLDDFLAVGKIYNKYNIKKTIVIETEIWINLYYFAAKNGELFIVNGRLTEKNLKSYMKLRWIIKKTLNRAKKIMVQSVPDKERYERLGIDTEIEVCSNLKYSIKYGKISEKQRNEYYNTVLDNDKKIIVCGSTRRGEEKIWLDIFKKINIDNEYQMVLVPRHLERLDEIERAVLENFSENGYSRLEKIQGNQNNRNEKDIIIVDKMGVLTDFYQMADFVFVGGTLVDIGGHSILEPLYYGRKPVIGQYFQNIEKIVRDAMEYGFVEIAKNEDDIIKYLKNSEKIDTREFFLKNNDIEKILREIF